MPLHSDTQRKVIALVLTLGIYALVSVSVLLSWSLPEPDESLRDITPLALMIAAATQPELQREKEAPPSAPPAPMLSPDRPVLASPPPASQPPAPPKEALKPRPAKPVERKVAVPATGYVQAPMAAAEPQPIMSPVASVPVPAVQEASPAPALSAAARADISAAYRAMIHGRIAAAQVYPHLARRMGQEGTVLVRFTVLADGRIDAVRVVESSGSDSLDAATVELFMSGLGGRFPPIPVELNKPNWTFSIPIRYQLNAG